VAPTALAASASVPLAAEPSVPVSDKSAPAATLATEPGVITETSDKNMPVAHVNKAQDATKNIVSDMPKPAKPAASAIVTKAAESASVQALLDAKNTEEPTAGANRFVVQVGAFADATRAREVRLKVEQAGLKTYTHVAETKDGKRTRVRVGPFATKAEAEKAAEKIKKLNLPAALLTL
jgi:DedD protein